MRKINSIIALGLAAFCAFSVTSCNCSEKIEASVPACIKDGVIELQTPAREPGQESALLLTCDPIETVRVGFIGLGMRGSGAVKRFIHLEGVALNGLCDLEADRVKASQETLLAAGFPAAREYAGEDAWKALCESDDIDLVYICTDWNSHVPMAVYAMEHGKHVAVEVPAAQSIDECWQLVNTCEKTRKHCMMLENCVYDFFEITALQMAQAGLFGEVLHAQGAYIHNLDPYWKAYHNNWRLAFNQVHRGDVYPTHGIGPVCEVLNIHRGDKMNYVVSMDTKSVHGAAVAKEQMGVDEFANGDHTVSLIRTELGKIIEIQHNVYATRPYSRLYQLTGTEGFATKYPRPNLSIGKESFETKEVYDSLMNAYKPKFVAEIEDKARQVGGHGGMDFIMDYRLIYCLHNGLPLDQDVYDAAEWSCLGELSAISLDHNSMPVLVPDFTRGDWNKIDGLKFAE